MHKFLAPIHFLKIDEVIPECNIIKGEDAVLKIDDDSIQKYGSIQLKEISTRPTFFLELESLKQPNLLAKDLNDSYWHKLALGLWLVKDNSVFNFIGYLFNIEQKFSIYDMRNVYLTNAEGIYSTTHFSRDEVINGLIYYNKVLELMQPGKVAPNYVSEEAIIVGANFTDYNNFDKLDKALTFIIKARATSNIMEKISWYIVAIECLYKFNEKSDLQFKLSYRVPHFLSSDAKEKQEIHDIILDAYELRSNYLHGGSIEKKNLKELKNQRAISIKIDDIARQTILEIINDNSKFMILNDKNRFKEFFHSSLLS